MAKVSKELSRRTNEYPVGFKAGRGPADINNSKSNRIQKPVDDDQDGKPDYGVSRELSEDMNARLLKGE